MKKTCVFCGEPMAAADKECKQCGWDSSKVSAPKSDPADVRARIVVGIGLTVAYGALFTLINGADLPAQPKSAANGAASEPVQSAVIQPVLPMAVSAPSDPAVKNIPRSSVVSVKVADVRNATVLPREAIHYEFEVAEGDQGCRITGQLKSGGGDVEIFLLHDEQVIFWRANPAGIPRSDWEPIRASDTSLDYELSQPGSYYLIVSNALSASAHKTVQVKATLKCARPAVAVASR